MKTLKEKLQILFENKNSKSYIRLVKSRPELNAEVIQCQKEIQSSSVMETLWCVINDAIPPLCECGSSKQFNTFNLGYRPYCGPKCTVRWKNHSSKIKKVWENEEKLANMVLARKNACVEKYGVSNPMFLEEVRHKVKNTNLLKYGVASPFESIIIKEKIKQTNLSRYGVAHPIQLPEIQKKAELSFKKNNPDVKDKMEIARKSFIDQHGVNPFAVDFVKEKLKKTRQEKYGYIHALQKHLSHNQIEILESKIKFIETLQGLTLTEAAEKLGVNSTTIARRAIKYNCRDIFSISSRSRWEFKIKNFLLENNLIEGVDFIQGDRNILEKQELDFYFPKINAAIEVGSIFWHSEINAGRDSKYHHNKWKKCKVKGIDLYQYWDYELQNAWPVISSKILYLFKKPLKTVGARKITDFRSVPIKEEKDFLSKYHIQGFTGDRKKTYGAYFNNELLALISIAVRPQGVEVVRYATNLSASYPGLFSKLLKFTLLELGITKSKILSFSDNRHSSGNLYFKSGFKIRHYSAPTYYYTNDYHSIANKKKFTRQKISSKFNINIEGKSEWQLMQELGYDRIWDAGKILWELDVDY